MPGMPHVRREVINDVERDHQNADGDDPARDHPEIHRQRHIARGQLVQPAAKHEHDDGEQDQRSQDRRQKQRQQLRFPERP